MYFVKLGYPITAIKCQPEELVACSLSLSLSSDRETIIEKGQRHLRRRRHHHLLLLPPTDRRDDW